MWEKSFYHALTIGLESAYISDYVTKPGLKTHTIFEAIRSVFNRNSEMLGGSLKRKEKARTIY